MSLFIFSPLFPRPVTGPSKKTHDLLRGVQGVCGTQKIKKKDTRLFLDVIRLKKLKSEEILEIRPAVINIPEKFRAYRSA